MKKLLNDINKLTKEELERANENFPQFASAHEGYAVILEEVEESKEEINSVVNLLEIMWKDIKRNNLVTGDLVRLKNSAQSLAAESIQVAAMAQKFSDMLGSEGK